MSLHPREQPKSNTKGAQSRVTVWAVLAVASLGLFFFFFSLFGPSVIFLGLFIAGIAGVGAMHFFLWGRAMESEIDQQSESTSLRD